MAEEYFDAVIVGAGLSGIGTACHLKHKCPDKTFAVLEARDSMGGTWDLFRYPGVRSDSDMHTLGYNFKPWREAKAIADGPSILNYVKEAAAENGVSEHIRYRHRVTKASWSSAHAAWIVKVEGKNGGGPIQVRCNFLLMCAGYYSYAGGYTPEFPSQERYTGKLVHPQQWPEDLEYAGKKVLVIGSGATAMTLIPALAKTAAQVTMLQRSPSYVVSRPDKDRLANLLREVLPERWAYAITRWKNVSWQQLIYRRTRTNPAKVKRQLLKMVRKELGPDYDVDTHFTPHYNPWDQRLCLVPNSDLFQVIRSGKASVITDEIECFTETGVKLKSGAKVEADIVVTATGLQLVVQGAAEMAVDGKTVDFADTYTYKGIMVSNVPNLVSTFGYINASWTLRADLIAEYVCRLLNHMDASNYRQCTPRLRSFERDMPTRPYIDNFSSGYMQRVMHLFPKQGDHAPWINSQSYGPDKQTMRRAPIEDGVLVFDSPASQVAAAWDAEGMVVPVALQQDSSGRAIV